MQLLHYLLGRPLMSQEEGQQKVGIFEGVAVFGLDALGSAAYGPEAALTILIPVSLLGVKYMLPLSLMITALLLLVFFSYRQTIGAYPNGGGAYTVAGQNLGDRAGILAGAALMLDYLLNVSVGISTGVGALVSAVPRLQPHILALCLSVLAILILANLRGLRQAGLLWMAPTYIFLACLLVVLIKGCIVSWMAHGQPSPEFPLPNPKPAEVAVGGWLLLRSFAAGCTALTGVEAVSNGVRNFDDPRDQTAKRTLTFIVAALALLLVGISILIRTYHIVATEPVGPQYQSVLSMLTSAVMGHGIFYYFTIGSILTVLSLSANTSFADFPQVCRVMAEDGYLPRTFTLRGRRLSYTVGVLILGLASAAVITLFGGITDRLIPLFAVGAFTSFTLSQAGMVEHWRKSEDRHAKLHIAVNGVGAVATGATTIVIFVAKFRDGAWLTVVVIGTILLLLRSVRRYYDRVEAEANVQNLHLDPLPRLPIMLVPVAKWNRASLDALQFACSLSDDVRVLHVADLPGTGQGTREDWQKQLDEAAQRAGVDPPKAVFVNSPFRSLADPILFYIQQAEIENPGRKIAVVVSEVVAEHWFHKLMHNYQAMLLKFRLFVEGNRGVVIVDMPWRLPSS